MIAIIGAGISGLIVANTLQKQNIPYILLEQAPVAGGLIQSKQLVEYLIEVGPNTIMLNEETENILKHLNITLPFNEALPSSKARYIYKQGRIRPLPTHPLPLLFGNFLSLDSKLSLVKEFFHTSVGPENETVYDFFVRHFNNEIADYVVSPFIVGIYAGDAKQLLIKDTFPLLKKYEISYGSILKGLIKNKSAGKRKMGSYEMGLSMLTNHLSNQLQAIQFNANVNKITKEKDHWLIQINEHETLKADKIVFTTPAYQVAHLIQPYWEDAAAAFHSIHYAPMAAVYTAFSKNQCKTPNGFGVLYPPIENKTVAGTIFNSASFSNRAPQEEFMLTHFVGGVHHPEYVQWDDKQLIQQVLHTIEHTMGIQAQPTFTYVHKWNKGIPQYDLKRNEAVQWLPTLESEHIYCTSNWTHGISLPDCIKNAFDLANRIAIGG
jgi:oxygen-dependent protoporphyrinogen oxidase